MKILFVLAKLSRLPFANEIAIKKYQGWNRSSTKFQYMLRYQSGY